MDVRVSFLEILQWNSEPPLSLPIGRIRLFLPYRTHLFYFLANLREFWTALSYPPEDARGIHPALMNAIYLATCWIVGGELDFLKGFFLAQTRYYLGKALETGDRLIQFLWANIILGNFLSLEGRTNEAYVTISSCIDFALACGMDVLHYRKTTPPAQTTLLPAPTDETDAVDRIRLSFVLYLMDRTLAMVTSTPSAFSRVKGPSGRWSDIGENAISDWSTLAADTEVSFMHALSVPGPVFVFLFYFFIFIA